VVALAAVLALLPSAALASSGTLQGVAQLRGMKVELMAATPGGKAPVRLGNTVSRGLGYFDLRYRGARPHTVKYLVATRTPAAAEPGARVPARTYRIAAALGEGPLPNHVSVDERTTVAIGYATAQFIEGDEVSGPNPGLRNAAAMTADLVNEHGYLSKVLEKFPNGESTSTEATSGALANLLATCRHQSAACGRVLKLAGAPGGGPAPDTLAAITDIARYPWHNVRPLYLLARRENFAAFGPTLGMCMLRRATSSGSSANSSRRAGVSTGPMHSALTRTPRLARWTPQVPGEGKHTGARSAVGHLRGRRAHDRQERRHVDHRAARRVVGQQMRDPVLTAEKDARQVHHLYPAPGLQ
jgi:hypothetical protein